MARKKSSPEGTAATAHADADADRRKTIKGHEVLFPSDARRKRIFIDGRPVHYGVVGGEYYLDVYAYDRAASLEKVVERYIGYLERTLRAKKEG